jgi:hypothetical protein
VSQLPQHCFLHLILIFHILQLLSELQVSSVADGDGLGPKHDVEDEGTGGDGHDLVELLPAPLLMITDPSFGVGEHDVQEYQHVLWAEDHILL